MSQTGQPSSESPIVTELGIIDDRLELVWNNVGNLRARLEFCSTPPNPQPECDAGKCVEDVVMVRRLHSIHDKIEIINSDLNDTLSRLVL